MYFLKTTFSFYDWFILMIWLISSSVQMKLLDIKNTKKFKYITMPSVLFIKIVIMTNFNRCDNHITMIEYSYTTIYKFYLNIINFLKIIYKH